MNAKERKTNIYTLYRLAQILERSSPDAIQSAELLYVEAADQADRYLPTNSELRAKVLIGCIDFYDSLGRKQDSELMQARLRSIAHDLLAKITERLTLSD